MPYLVMVSENFGAPGDSAPYLSQRFDLAEQALSHCKAIVDEYLEAAYRWGMSPQALWDSYTSFGEDPFIRCDGAPAVEFSAWTYARHRCTEIACAAVFEPPTRSRAPSPVKPSPLEMVATATRPAILSTWLQDAIESYCEATELLGHDAERGRLLAARDQAVSTELLEPCYDALARRYASEVTDGRQGDLFATDPRPELRRQWSGFATRYLRQRGRAQLKRWVLQATVGLSSGIDRTTAAKLLVGHVLDAPLPEL